MFDVFIAFNPHEPVSITKPPNLTKSQENHFEYSFTSDNVYVHGWSHSINDLAWHDRDEHLLVIIGDVSFRRSVYNKSFVPSSTQIVDCIVNDTFDTKTFQGNYWILYYNKMNHSLRIISDPLTVLPLYASSLRNNYVFSTNLLRIKHLGLKINKRVLLELLLFSQMLTTDTLLEGVDSLKPGYYHQVDQGGIVKWPVYDLEKAVFNDRHDKLNTNELIHDFNYSVLSLASNTEKNLASLTGGFDSRSVVSVLIKEGLPFLAFSFGRFGGPNTEKPLKVRERLGINYRPIYLGDEYEEMYSKYAEEVIEWSDGSSVFERANYLYVADKLRNESNSYLSGLIGGELFAPMTFFVPFCTEMYRNIFYLGHEFDVKNMIRQSGISEYINDFEPHVFDSLEFTVKEYQQNIQRVKNYKVGYLHHLYDFINTGFRTYYGGQIQMERGYIHNKIPFYSLDLLERMIFSNHKKAFKKPFRGDPYSKRKNRILQAKIIMNNSPELGSVQTDRGFAPNDLLSIYGKVKSASQYILNRHQQAASEPEFTSNRWSSRYYSYLLDNGAHFDDDVFNEPKILEFMKVYHESKYSKSFNSLLSVARWVSK